MSKTELTTEQKIDSIILNNTKDFEINVANILSKRDWVVEPSKFYADLLTKKSREIDIVASKEFRVRCEDGNSDYFTIRLFIETKSYIPPSVLWFNGVVEEILLRLIGDNNIFRGGVYLGEVNNSQYVHHYINNDYNIVNRWQCDKNWGDVIFDAWNQCLNAFIFFQSHNKPKGKFIDFPLVVANFSDNIFGSDKKKVSESFQLGVDYSYSTNENKKESKYFLIDWIDVNFLDDFLCYIENNDAPIFKDKLWELSMRSHSSAKSRNIPTRYI